MSVNAEKKTSECRALVALSPQTGASACLHRAEASFIVQLSANVKGFSQYRAKRREQPEVGAERYRTTIADALACRPKGQRLNYCA